MSRPFCPANDTACASGLGEERDTICAEINGTHKKIKKKTQNRRKQMALRTSVLHGYFLCRLEFPEKRRTHYDVV